MVHDIALALIFVAMLVAPAIVATRSADQEE